MKRVILDTNALMAISEFKLDVFSAVERAVEGAHSLCVLEGTVIELQRIETEQRGKYRLGAKLALQLLTQKKVKVLPSEGNVDDQLAAYSAKGALILTQDAALKKRLTKPYLTIRAKKNVIIC